jgi:hypothetical protein
MIGRAVEAGFSLQRAVELAVELALARAVDLLSITPLRRAGAMSA